MSTSFRGIVFTLCLQCNQILNLFANKPDLKRLMGNSESAHWPLQDGYPGLTIKNLNEYVSLFSHCLVNIQNYHGIEIIGIKSPVHITRFDVANLEHCSNPSSPDRYKIPFRFFFGKIPPKTEQNCTTDYEQILKYSDKSVTSRWYCKAEFDLFFPEPTDAPHIVYYSQIRLSLLSVRAFEFKRNLFDIPSEYTEVDVYRENWSKILLL